MDIINVVHLFTFYSAIWENEGSTANGKCDYFGTPVPERHPFDVHGFRGGRGGSCLTSPKPRSLVAKTQLEEKRRFLDLFQCFFSLQKNRTEDLQPGCRTLFCYLDTHPSLPQPRVLSPGFARLAAVYL